MRRDFSRAILAAGIFAAVGFVLVYAALKPRPPPAPDQRAVALTADSCTRSLGRWGALEGTVTHATALAGDVGGRCRLLTCPDIDCTALQELRGALTALAATLKQIAAAPALITDKAESTACGAVVAPLAQRLTPGLAAAQEALDLCSAQAICAVLRQGDKGASAAGGLLEQARAEADRIEALSARLRLAESPAVAVSLDLAAYVAGDAMGARIEPGGNRCLAQGGIVGVYPDKGIGSLADPPLSEAPVEAGLQPVRRLLEAPHAPGRYLLAVTGKTMPARALGIAPFAVESPRGGCSGFTGRWETDRGVLQASVKRGLLRGTYRRPGAVKPGFLTGQVKGRHFHGSWVSELGSGGAHLVLNATGDRFLGTAGDTPGEEDGAGLWRGRCASSRAR